METDLVCPSCRTSWERATAAPPELTGGEPSPLLKMLPIFGGAMGGLLYAGLVSAQAHPYGSGPTRSSGTNSAGPLKRVFGVLLLLAGGLFLVLAIVHACDTWNIARRQPAVATAADLCRKEYTQAAPEWIAHTFTEAVPTQLTVTRQRLGVGGEVEARCLLVRVEDRWLLATVAPGFDGNQLVGRLIPFDSPSARGLVAQLQKLAPNLSVLLPYEFNGVDGSASDQRIRYTAAGLIGVFGLLGLWLGRYLLRKGRRPRAQSPDLAAAGWTYQAPPAG
jgi:hypothetical protein